MKREHHGGVAQLGEHLPCKQGVMGSNPIISTRQWKREFELSQGIKRDKEAEMFPKNEANYMGS